MAFEDITLTGPVGLRYNPTRPLNNPEPEETLEFDINLLVASTDDLLKNTLTRQDISNYSKQSLPIDYSEFQIGSNWGSSKYDLTEGVLNEQTLLNIEDVRALRQSAWAKWGNGVAKFATTAAITLVDGTLGTMAGVIQGLSNVVNPDTEAGFFAGLWDNSVTNAMAKLQEDIDKNIFINHYSLWELNAPWYLRLGTANFWADGVLKNMGFMAGTAASMALTGGIGKAVGITAKLGKVGKLADRATRAVLSSHGEAAIEAVNSAKSSKEALDYNLAERKNQLQELLDNDYRSDLEKIAASEGRADLLKPLPDGNMISIRNIQDLDNYYTARQLELDLAIAAYQDEYDRKLTAAGNAVYGMNVVFLTVANNLNMGSLLKGGYATNKAYSNIIKRYIADNETKSLKDFTEAVIKGTAKYGLEEIKNLNAKTAGKALLHMAEEGGLEGVQKIASTTNEMRVLSQLNNYAKNTILGAELNPGVADNLIAYSKAVMEAYNQDFGTPGSQGWEEVVIGALSAGIGMPGFRYKYNADTKDYLRKFVWNTAFTEARANLTDTYNEVLPIIDLLNDYISNNSQSSVIRNYRHATALSAINDILNDAIEAGDITEYKNQEIHNLVENLLFFLSTGNMDDFMSIIDALALENIDDETIDLIIALTVDSENGKSPLEAMSRDDLKVLYADKARSTRLKIENIKKNIEYFKTSDKLEDLFSSDYIESAMGEFVYTKSLLDDTERRLKEVTEELNSIEGDDAIANEQRKEKKYAIAQLTRLLEKLKKQLQTWKDSPETLTKEIDRIYKLTARKAFLQDLASTIELYKTAYSISDILDIYRLADPLYRDLALEEAKQTANPENKALLEDFLKFVGDVEVLKSMVAKNGDGKYISIFENAINNYLDKVADDYSTEGFNNRKTLKDSILELIDLLTSAMEDYKKLDLEGALPLSAKLGVFQLKNETIPTLLLYADAIDTIDDLRAALTFNTTPTPVEEGPVVTVEEPQPELTVTPQLPQPVTPQPLLKSTEPKLDKNAKTYVDAAGYKGLTIKTASRDDLIKYSLTDPTIAAQIKNLWNQYVGERGDLKTKENYDALKEVIKILHDNNVYLGNLIAGKIIQGLQDSKDVIGDWYDLTYNAAPVESVEKVQPELTVELNTTKEQTITADLFEKPVLTDNDSFNDVTTGEGFRGNTFPLYRRSLLELHIMLEPTHELGTLAQWLKELTWYPNIQKIIDTKLSKLPKHTTIHYLHVNGRNDLILLAIKYTDEIQKVIDDSFSANIKDTNDGKYVIVGTMGYENPNTPTATNFGKMLLLINDEANTTENSAYPFYVYSKKTNEIKAITAGKIVTATIEEVGEESRKVLLDRSVKDLLANKETNPHGLKADDLSFIVIEGTKEKPTYKRINVKIGMKVHNPGSNIPGLVYLLVPSNEDTDTYVPIFIKPLLISDLNGELDTTTDYGKKIINLIGLIADVTLDVPIRQRAANDLRKLLIFEQGHYFSVNDTGSVKVRDKLDTIVADLGENKDEATLSMLNYIKLLKPRISLDTTTLANSPGFYVESNLLTTDSVVLGTVGSNFYIYNVTSDGSPDTTLTRIQTALLLIVQPVERRLVFFKGKQYEFNGKNFTDIDSGTIIEMPEILAILTDNFPELNIVKFDNDANTYYYISDNYIIIEHKNGFSENYDKNVIQKVKDKRDADLAKSLAKNALKEEAADIALLTTQPQDQQVTTSEPKVEPASEVKTKDNTSVTANSENALLLMSVKNLENLKKNPIFARANRDIVIKLFEKYGVKDKTALDNLLTVKFPGGYKTREDLEEILHCEQ